MMTAALSKSDSPSRFLPHELQAISQQIRQNFAPRLSLVGLPASHLKLSPHELSHISAEMSREFAPQRSVETAKLVLLPVDPQHIHAYWTLTAPQMAALSTTTPDTALTLRIYAQTPTTNASPQPVAWFDIPIQVEPAQQTVRLPDTLANLPNVHLYATVIAQAGTDNSITAYAQSNTLEYVGGGRTTDLPEQFKNSLSSAHYSGKKTL